MQVNAQLRPDETERVMTLVKNSSIQQQELFLSQIKTLTVEEAVATIRCLLEDCERQTPESNASTSEPVA